MSSHDSRILVIGAGIAGASVAAHLALRNATTILEMEDRPGYHTTGRSAAVYEPNYGPRSILALTRAGRDFYHSPPDGFAGAPLTAPRPSLFLMPEGQEEAARTFLATAQGIERIGIAEARALHPLLRESYPKACYLDTTTSDIDVDLLHQGYLRMFKARGGRLVCEARATAITYRNGGWTVSTPKGEFTAPIIVNAAGAWADQVAILAGAQPVGLVPKRRSIAVVPPPANCNVMSWPLITDTGETWYCKPSGGKLLVSPADATPVDPHDAYAEDETLAVGIERFQQAVDFEVTHVERNWAGLRTFAPDGEPVCGYDPNCEGFFWLAGQGGYGIQSAPGLSRFAAALIERRPIPDDIADQGLHESDLLPGRFSA
ncbi:MAG: FAD-binding oxidoreductase [Rhizobiales bacterium]|nr:FAD-binding oxidoreductase [Hyphomicrobiales bacterium]